MTKAVQPNYSHHNSMSAGVQPIPAVATAAPHARAPLAPVDGNAALDTVGCRPKADTELVSQPSRVASSLRPPHQMRDPFAWRGKPGLSEVMRAIWSADDVESLHNALQQPYAKIFEVNAFLGIDALMLAHRLQRPKCARILFLNRLFRLYALGVGYDAVRVAHEAHLLAAAVRRMDVHPDHFSARTYEHIRQTLESAWADDDARMYQVGQSLRQRLAADPRTSLLSLPGIYAAEHFVFGALLGRILADFDQDTLIYRPQRCQLMYDLVDHLRFPLHLEVNFSRVCSGRFSPESSNDLT